MARLRARPEETVFVGDSRADLETTAAAGVRFVAVSWGFGPTGAQAAAAAAAVAGDTADLLRWLSGGPPGRE